MQQVESLKIAEFKKEIKKVIEETIHKEIIKLRVELMPYISNEEQKETEKLYGKPSFDVGKIRKVKI